MYCKCRPAQRSSTFILIIVSILLSIVKKTFRVNILSFQFTLHCFSNLSNLLCVSTKATSFLQCNFIFHNMSFSNFIHSLCGFSQISVMSCEKPFGAWIYWNVTQELGNEKSWFDKFILAIIVVFLSTSRFHKNQHEFDNFSLPTVQTIYHFINSLKGRDFGLIKTLFLSNLNIEQG